MKIKYLPLFLLLFWACHSKSVFVHPKEAFQPSEETSIVAEQTLFLIGDVGESPSESRGALQAMKAQLDKLDPRKVAVVFLGDNIYPRGLHEKDHPLRKQDEERIIAQLEIVKDFEGEVFFIPGNHDWDKGGENGFEAIQETRKIYTELFR